MKFIKSLLFVIIIGFLNTKCKDKFIEMNKEDNVSFSQSDGAVQYKLEFDLDVYMKEKKIKGKVRIHYKCKSRVDTLNLDIRGLNIKKVKDSNCEEMEFNIYKNTKNNIGDALYINLVDNCENDSYVDIYYSVNKNSIGLHFSDSSVLHDKRYTFMYTHGEAIYGRTFFPSQDTPSLKILASAKIRIDDPYTALFSGKLISKEEIDDDRNEFVFDMDKPIPTYLITFAAGVIEKVQIPNSRCEVWGEKDALKWVYQAFSYCEDYLKYYETYKRFEFNKMTFLIVPDDFPFSGMENPYVTYITESILIKDRSYSKVIAHEIVHFWSGNLVTNKGWSSFWLNEGITTYLSRKAIQKIHGDEEFYFNMYNGLFKLGLAIKDLKRNANIDSSFRSLSPKITDDPYITFSRIPYEKGAFFMYYLETLIGSQIMQKILSDYFTEFSFKSLDGVSFIKFIKEKIIFYIGDSKGEEISQKIQWDQWLHGTEMLPVDFSFPSKKIEEIKRKVAIIANGEKPIKELIKMFSDMKIVERVRILEQLSQKYNKITPKARIKILKLLTNDNLFKDSSVLKASRIILKARLIENNKEKLNYLAQNLESLKYYKIKYLKALFYIVKEADPNRKVMEELLKKYKDIFNPLTFLRLKERFTNFPHNNIDKYELPHIEKKILKHIQENGEKNIVIENSKEEEEEYSEEINAVVNYFQKSEEIKKYSHNAKNKRSLR